MSLIENLEKDNWEEFLRPMFAYTLDVLKNDRFRSVGSAVDDLRAGLARGGVSRVKEHLNHQMTQLRFPADKQAAVLACVDQLAEENRLRLLDLAAGGVINMPRQELLAAYGMDQTQYDDWVSRTLAGERPFEDWMYAHGHSYKDIVEVYRVIDWWLQGHGLISSPGKMPPPRPPAAPATDP